MTPGPEEQNPDLDRRGPEGGQDPADLLAASTSVGRDDEFAQLLNPNLAKSVREELVSARREGILACFSAMELNELCFGAKVIEVPINSELRTDKKGIYILSSGSVQGHLVDAAGAHHPVLPGKPGDVVGEMSFLISPSDLYEATIHIETESPVKAIRVDPNRFRSCLANNPAALLFMLCLVEKRLSFMNQFTSQAVALDPSDESLESKSLADRAADGFQNRVGKWRFVIGGLLTTFAYMGINTAAKATGLPYLEGFPFEFLNLGFSLSAGFSTSIFLISQNRMAKIDKAAMRVVKVMLKGIRQDIGTVREELAEARRDLKTVLSHNLVLQAQIKELLAMQIESVERLRALGPQDSTSE